MTRPERIKIMFVVPDLRVGGAERHLLTLAAGLDYQRFHCSVVCIGEEGELFPALLPAGVEAQALHLGGKRNSLRALRRLRDLMLAQQPDIVVLRGYNAEVLGRLAAQLAGKPHCVVWVHDFDYAGEHRSRFRDVLNSLLVPLTSRYFGVAEVQKAYMAERLHCPPVKIRIIHNGVDVTHFRGRSDRRVLAEFGIAEDAPVVGIVAALRPEKDHRTLFRAVRLVLNEVPTMHLLVIGDGPDRRALELFASGLNIATNVHFTGSRGDVNELLSAVDVFTLTSTTEAFPLSVLEAMAGGLATVCTDVGGVSEAVENGRTGYLVPPGDEVQLAHKITKLLTSPDLRHIMGQAGRRRVEGSFSLERSIVATQMAFEELVS